MYQRGRHALYTVMGTTNYTQGMDKLAKVGLTAVAAVLVAGVLAVGITTAVNLQQDRRDTAVCVVSGDC